MDKYGGGLRVIQGENNGGKQSKVLKFKGADGKSYKFRSTLKYAKFAIDPELRETIGEYIIQDQVSIKHPYAPVIAFKLLSSAGVLMPEPKMFVLPYDKKLDDNPDFKGLLGTMQEIPGKRSPFLGFEEAIKTTKLLKKIDSDPRNRVDAAQFLKARLMDIFISDWDRHHKQWLWARTNVDSNIVWKPVSQDRDEAFCRYDGLMPWLFAEAVPRFEGISERYPKIDFIAWEGRYLDRKFLTTVTKNQWDSVTNYLRQQLTNSAIHDAVNTMPGEWYDLSGRMLEKILRSRRDKLNEIAEDYYEYIFSEPDVWATDQNETVRIKTIDNENVSVEITEEHSPKPYYSMVFNSGITSEVRLYLQDGNDHVIIEADHPNDIRLKVIGGNVNDVIIDSSKAPGNNLDVTFYSNGNNTLFRETGNISIDKSYYKIPGDVIKKIDHNPQDFGSLLTFIPSLSYNTDEGLIFGGIANYNRYGFRYDPFKYRLSFNGSYATRTKGYVLKFNSAFNNIFRNISTGIYAEFSGSQYSKFYGYGNESILDKTGDKEGYYKIEEHSIRTDVDLKFRLSREATISSGITFNSIYVEQHVNSVLSSQSYLGTKRKTYAGLTAGIIYDVRKSGIVPFSSTYASLTARIIPGIFNNDVSFTKLCFSFSRILFENFSKNSFFTASVYADKLFGTFPFYESAFLGGSRTLRGYAKDRFSGDASLAVNIDLDLYLFKTRIFLPVEVSLLGISDAGRVFSKGESSGRIHYSYGGGFNLGYFKRMFNLKVYGANSTEGVKIYLGMQAGF